MDTIFALATARGRAGVAVIRISGPNAKTALAKLASPALPRQATLRKLTHGGMVLDEAVVLLFPGPNSFTGEDVVELQVHGSNAVVSSLLSALSRMDGLRQADAGEFTRRALENNRLDLAQVEGLSDLVEAETEAQRRQAQRVFSGELGKRSDSWREMLIRAAALLEATIDFVDEDVPVDVMPEVKSLLSTVHNQIRREVDGFAAAERIRDGFEVAIVGAPNVGKSSLLNHLAGREAAITSEVAGTTRDVIEVSMDLGGIPVTLLDTAGLRSTSDQIEAIGVERAKQRAERADLRIFLVRDGEIPSLPRKTQDIVVRTKADIAPGDISVVTGQGIDTLISNVTASLSERAGTAGIATRERHRIGMERAINALSSAQDKISTAPELAELVAEDLRAAIRSLDSLVGRVDVEDLLDDIFSSFCIGK